MALAYCFTAYGGPENQVLLDLPVPTPGPGQLLVDVHAAGVDPADWKVRSGLRKATIETTFPAVLGREVAGTVRAVGSDAGPFAVGDEVFGSVSSGHGGYAEVTLLDAGSTALKPKKVSFAAAATLPVASGTAYDAIAQLDIRPNDTLLVIGAGGGVGIPAVQLAVDRGARVIGAASEAKREVVEGFGARWVGPDEEAGPGVTAVFDLVGGDVLRRRLPEGARVVSVADSALATELGGSGVTRRRTTSVFGEVADLVASGRLDPHVTARFPLELAGDALAMVEAGHALGKTVLVVQPE